jgi:hypothetical protein
LGFLLYLGFTGFFPFSFFLFWYPFYLLPKCLGVPLRFL